MAKKHKIFSKNLTPLINTLKILSLCDVNLWRSIFTRMNFISRLRKEQLYTSERSLRCYSSSLIWSIITETIFKSFKDMWILLGWSKSHHFQLEQQKAKTRTDLPWKYVCVQHLEDTRLVLTFEIYVSLLVYIFSKILIKCAQV